jgi:hypothetical protein
VIGEFAESYRLVAAGESFCNELSVSDRLVAVEESSVKRIIG